MNKRTPTNNHMQSIDTIIFDVDGLLLDSREFIFNGFEYILNKFNYPIPNHEFMAQQIGKSIQECYKNLAPNSNVQQLCLEHSIYQSRPEAIKLIKVYPHVKSTLTKLKNNNYKLAVFSSRTNTLIPSLITTKIDSFFPVIISGQDVKHHKPHPEGLIKALSLLNSPPTNAVMIGDAAVDILAGQAAGVKKTIGLTHGFGLRQELVNAKADFIADSIKEIIPIINTLNYPLIIND